MNNYKNRRFLLPLVLSLAALCFGAPTAAAQEKCDLTLARSPDFFNLRLGMTPADVKSFFGKTLKLKIRKQGSFFQNFITKPPPAFLPGVRAIYLRFFDYKLYQIEIFYQSEYETDEARRRSLVRFVDRLSIEKNLPALSWTNENGFFYLRCADFSLVADNVLNPRAELTDRALRDRFLESQAEKSDKKKK